MSAFPTGNELADTTVLLQLDDQEIGRVCQADAYLNHLCQNEFFWKQRIEQRYPEFLHLRDQLQSYRELYLSIISRAYALLIGETQLTLYNDIRAAYQELLKWLVLFTQTPQVLPIERANELPNILGVNRYPIRLYRTNPYGKRLLVDLISPQIFVDPNLSNMPVLLPKIMVAYTLIGPHEMNAVPPSDKVFEELLRDAQSGRLPEEGFTIQRTDNQATLPFTFVAPDLFISNPGAPSPAQIRVFFLKKINGRFMFALLPAQYLQGVPLRWSESPQGEDVMIPRQFGLINVFRTAPLQWVPIENLQNYL